MRPFAAFAAVLALAPGCASRTSGAAATATGVAILGSALLVATSNDDEPPPESDGGVDFHYDFDFTPVVAGGLAVIGAGFTIAGIMGLANEEPKPDPAARVVVGPQQTDLDRLALAASGAARRGDCDIARSYAQNIRQRDLTYYHAQVASDPVIGPCLK